MSSVLQTEPVIYSEKEQEHSFAPYCVMEQLLNKLKLLNYVPEFLTPLKMRPIHKYYFIIPTNPGEQFHMFSSLAAWLIRKSGKIFEMPQESDDPNSTISNILEALRANGISVDFPPNKLKQGVGEHVVYVLNCLAKEALKKTHFTWDNLVLPEETEEEAEVIDDEAEIILDRIEEEMWAAYSSESDDEQMLHINDFNTSTRTVELQPDIAVNVNLEEWKLELERVMPQLKVVIKNDGRDWRAHVEQMKMHKSSIDNSLSTTKVQLEKLHKDISVALDKISNREKYLNRELEPILEQYRELQDSLSKVKTTYKSLSGGVAERNRELSRLTDKLESVKQQMDERGSSMTDGTPLVNIKKAISKIKSEITEMDVRIGVLEFMLVQSKLKEKKMLEEDLGY